LRISLIYNFGHIWIDKIRHISSILSIDDALEKRLNDTEQQIIEKSKSLNKTEAEKQTFISTEYNKAIEYELNAIESTFVEIPECVGNDFHIPEKMFKNMDIKITFDKLPAEPRVEDEENYLLAGETNAGETNAGGGTKFKIHRRTKTSKYIKNINNNNKKTCKLQNRKHKKTYKIKHKFI